MTALEALRQRADKARDHQGVTCAASRHVQIVAEALARGETLDEPEHVAESMLAVVAALWEARRSLASEVADAARVLAWAQETPRRPANHAFTAGAERQAAYWIEWAEAAKRKRYRLAGHFFELRSGMSYRLWEQAGHEPEPGTVALYEQADLVVMGCAAGERSKVNEHEAISAWAEGARVGRG